MKAANFLDVEILDNKYQVEQGVATLFEDAKGRRRVATRRDASEQFKALDIPRSKWQQRMKTRWTITRQY